MMADTQVVVCKAAKLQSRVFSTLLAFHARIVFGLEEASDEFVMPTLYLVLYCG
eukprot:m.172991 g.172991  ORF g.172991 m.172991 type:complete len:54 (+) comp13622_c0_seq1:1415-1576(+)